MTVENDLEQLNPEAIFSVNYRRITLVQGLKTDAVENRGGYHRIAKRRLPQRRLMRLLIHAKFYLMTIPSRGGF